MMKIKKEKEKKKQKENEWGRSSKGRMKCKNEMQDKRENKKVEKIKNEKWRARREFRRNKKTKRE